MVRQLVVSLVSPRWRWRLSENCSPITFVLPGISPRLIFANASSCIPNTKRGANQHLLIFMNRFRCCTNYWQHSVGHCTSWMITKPMILWQLWPCRLIKRVSKPCWLPVILTRCRWLAITFMCMHSKRVYPILSYINPKASKKSTASSLHNFWI